MNLSERTESYLAIYGLVPKLLAGPLTEEATEEMPAFLLARGTLDKLEEARPLLSALDEAVARALRQTSVGWWLEVTRASLDCGFHQEGWWEDLLRQAAERPTELRKAG